MGVSREAFVQVAPDGSGKQIRNLQVTAVEPDGSLATVEMQVVAIADDAGNILDFTTMQGVLTQIAKTNEAILNYLKWGQ